MLSVMTGRGDKKHSKRAEKIECHFTTASCSWPVAAEKQLCVLRIQYSSATSQESRAGLFLMVGGLCLLHKITRCPCGPTLVEAPGNCRLVICFVCVCVHSCAHWCGCVTIGWSYLHRYNPKGQEEEEWDGGRWRPDRMSWRELDLRCGRPCHPLTRLHCDVVHSPCSRHVTGSSLLLYQKKVQCWGCWGVTMHTCSLWKNSICTVGMELIHHLSAFFWEPKERNYSRSSPLKEHWLNPNFLRWMIHLQNCSVHNR